MNTQFQLFSLRLYLFKTASNCFTSDIGKDSSPHYQGRGHLVFYLNVVQPSISAETISDVYLTIHIDGRGDSTTCNARFYEGRTNPGFDVDCSDSGALSTVWSKIGSDTPIFEEVETNGQWGDSHTISNNTLEEAVKNRAGDLDSYTSRWFAIGIQNTDESNAQRAFKLKQAELQFLWTPIVPPVIISAIPTSSNGVKVHWNKVNEMTGYRIIYGNSLYDLNQSQDM